ncbi:tyrosine-type recombinase/integrase [Haliangium ochraceum]|uniref:Integrase family protein n=1 Tax=Haliangium ochraceum (strain DSM 14365 / JCM 11303 / SMP-2) TaxID=502025 RepID=D0LP79_HALO1|nr:tyrosine-type recombinase/integrase [Haliangium ochraceum]ACY13444.1 integrase family protein [Haliangium ochraceum DSM 14365]
MTAYAHSTRRPPKSLTEHEQRLLLKASGEHRAGFRDHVIFSIALGTGLREHEILSLDVGDVFDGAGSGVGASGAKARRRLQLRVFKRSSDSPAEQEVILPDVVRAKLDKLYRWKKRNGESLAADAPIFVSRKGNRLSARQLRERFHHWQERAGFERRLGFHALRHTACSNIYRRTKDIRLTQRFARHKSIVTTSIYAHPTDEDLFRAVLDLPC